MFLKRDETTSTTASSLTNMFDPHIYGCQTLMTSASTSTIQSIVSGTTDQQMKQFNQTPHSSPQKNKHVLSNTVIPIQSTGVADGSSVQRKNSTPNRPSIGELKDIVVVGELSGNSEMITTTHLTQNDIKTTENVSNCNSGEVSRKTSTVSDCTSSDYTPENTILSPKCADGAPIADHIYLAPNELKPLVVTPTSALEQVKQSPVRKLSRFLVSPVVVTNANNELSVTEAPKILSPNIQTTINENIISMETQSTLQQQQTIDSDTLTDDVSHKSETSAADLDSFPAQSSVSRMPETLEQLKIELENITHAHVNSKAKELSQGSGTNSVTNVDDYVENSLQQGNPSSLSENTNTNIESFGGEAPNADVAYNTNDNTSVYNSRRTSADLNTMDVNSTASNPMEFEENLVNDLQFGGAGVVYEDTRAPQQTSVDRSEA